MRSLRVFALLGAFVVLMGLVTVAGGCGGKGKTLAPDTVLAKVDGKSITAGYYEKKLGHMQGADMPRGEDGTIVDTTKMPGKLKFLDTIINKEVMVNIAKRTGYDSAADIEYARKTLTQFESVNTMRERFVNQPAAKIEEADIQEFYKNFGRVRHCRYFITNARERAVEGRAKALTGVDWEDLFKEFHDGVQSGELKYKISIPYGRFIPAFEKPIYDCAVGDVTEPIQSAYGWWVLKIDREERDKVPALEEARQTIVSTIVNRRQMQLIDEFKEQVHRKHKMYVHEDALLKVYAALPKDSAIFYPGTQDPVRREDLKALEIAPADFEIDFYGYERDGEPRKYTIGDFKTAYDRMNTFERPKWGDMVGGLREKIVFEIDRALMAWEAEDRGMDKDPEVIAKVDEKIEEMLVQKLFEDSVHVDKNVAPAALDSAWALHEKDYDVPETRSGKRIICPDADKAAQAYAALSSGEPWRKVFNTYCVDPTEKASGGAIFALRADATGPERDALFALQPEQFSQPFPLGDGRFSIVSLDGVAPPHKQSKQEAAQVLVQRIQNSREEMAFRDALEGWKAKLKIEVFEKQLGKTRSWKELADEVNAASLAASAGNQNSLGLQGKPGKQK